MPSHTHSVVTDMEIHNWATATNPTYNAWVQSYAANQQTLTSTGGGAQHNNLQPYLVVNYIIKY